MKLMTVLIVLVLATALVAVAGCSQKPQLDSGAKTAADSVAKTADTAIQAEQSVADNVLGENDTVEIGKMI